MRSKRSKVLFLQVLCFTSPRTFVLRAANFAGQVGFAAGVRLKKITAVGAEYERSNRSHCSFVSRVALWLVRL